MSPYDFEKTHTKIITVFLICTLIGLFFLGQQAFFNYSMDKEVNQFKDLVFYLIYSYSWGILLFVIIPAAGRFRLEKSKLLKNIPVHIGIGLVVAFLHRIITLGCYFLIFPPEITLLEFIEKIKNKVIGGSFDSFVTYWLILGVYYGFDYYRQYREHRVKASELESKLANAKLQALKMQLHPHFLFNTLHAISSLMEEDIKTAQKMIAKISDLLRQTLDNAGAQEVSLSQELEFLSGYLEIEQIRFQERLKVTYNIDPASLKARVPNLILQPLVENAIKHGISPSAEGGNINLSARFIANELELIVSDDGRGSDLTIAAAVKKGLGLKNTYERLKQLYGDNFSLEIKSRPEKGFSVIIIIPFNEFSENENN